MRTFVVVGLCLAFASCDDDKPAGRPTAAVDALWKLAPEGTTGAIVISPYGLGMIDGGIAALKSFFAKGADELAPLATQLDGVLGELGPIKDFSLASLHLTPTKPAALFFAKEGLVAVWPIADRDAFVSKRKGTRATTPDGIDKLSEKAQCKQLGPHYVCAASEAQLATIGKSAIGERLKKLGSRGDIEIVATELPLQGPDQPRSSLVAALTLERGQWVIRGLLGNPPDSLTAKLAAPTKPRTTIGKSAGFAVFDIRQVLDAAGTEAIIEGVTESDLVKSISGPMTVDIPAGSRVLDMRMPLSNPKPMQDVLAKCTQVKSFAALGAQLVDGVCKIKAPQAGLELDLWVEDNTMRIGQKGAQLVGDPVPMPRIATELANGNWAMTFWGRGTMLARQATDKPTPLEGVDPVASTQSRVLSMLNEVGFGVKKDGDSLRFLATLRTAFANPQDVVDKLVAVTGMEVLANTASTKGSSIAVAHQTSLFAGDYAAGQHGMLIPTQMLDTAMQIIIPALIRYTRGSQPTQAEAPQAPPPPGAMTTQLVVAFATKGYEIWKAKNPDKPCPPDIAAFGGAIGPAIPTKDEWGNDFVLKCGKDLPKGAKDIAVISAGPDGKLGTADDIKSY